MLNKFSYVKNILISSADRLNTLYAKKHPIFISFLLTFIFEILFKIESFIVFFNFYTHPYYNGFAVNSVKIPTRLEILEKKPLFFKDNLQVFENFKSKRIWQFAPIKFFLEFIFFQKYLQILVLESSFYRFFKLFIVATVVFFGYRSTNFYFISSFGMEWCYDFVTRLFWFADTGWDRAALNTYSRFGVPQDSLFFVPKLIFFYSFFCIFDFFYFIFFILVFCFCLFIFINFRRITNIWFIFLNFFFFVCISSAGIFYFFKSGAADLFFYNLTSLGANQDIRIFLEVGGFISISFFIYYYYLSYWNETRNRSDVKYLFERCLLSVFLFMFLCFFLASQNLIFMFLAVIGLNASVYILIAQPKVFISLESAVKYFGVGLVATVFFLQGSSFLFYEFGSSFFSAFAALLYLSGMSAVTFLVFFGFLFIFLFFFIKLAVAPFSFWGPDVYEGTTFFSAAILILNKVIFFFLLCQIASIAVLVELPLLPSLFVVFSVLSILLGGSGAIYEQKVKRFLAFSGTVNLGFTLAVFFYFNTFSFLIALNYMILYVFTSIFILINWSSFQRGRGGFPGLIFVSDFAGLLGKSPIFLIPTIFFLFSTSGLPPFVGFFPKFWIFTSIFFSITGFSSLAVFLILAILLLSPLAAFNYIRILKIIVHERQFFKESFKSNLTLDAELLFIVVAFFLFLSIYNVYCLYTYAPDLKDFWGSVMWSVVCIPANVPYRRYPLFRPYFF